MSPRRKRHPDPYAIRHLAAAHGTADTDLISQALRYAAEHADPPYSMAERDALTAMAEEHERANRDRHLFLRNTQ